MLELLMTSHGSSESCGVKQGTGFSRVLRAITPQMQEVRGSIDPKRRKNREEKKEKQIGRVERRQEGKEVRSCIRKRASTTEVSV